MMVMIKILIHPSIANLILMYLIKTPVTNNYNNWILPLVIVLVDNSRRVSTTCGYFSNWEKIILFDDKNSTVYECYRKAQCIPIAKIIKTIVTNISIIF